MREKLRKSGGDSASDNLPGPRHDADSDNVAIVDNVANVNEPEANPNKGTVNELDRDDDADWNEPIERGADEDPFESFVHE